MAWTIPTKEVLENRARSVQFPTGLFIDGVFRESRSKETFETLNPSTGTKLVDVSAAQKPDIDDAVASATNAFNLGKWASLSGRARGTILRKVAELIREHAETFALLESINNGKPIVESQWAAPVAAEVFEYYAGWADKYHGEVVPLKTNNLNYVVHEPLGVVAAITPWNFPTTQPSFKVAPALAMGNSVVLKPAEQTPFTALLLGQICCQAGVPAGVFNVVPGTGEVAGASLVAHPDTAAISFTGSTSVGRQIMAASSSQLKKLSLECGGKSANIVFEDAEMDKAVRGAFTGMFYNQGHVCNAGSRLLLHETIHDQFVEKLVQLAKELKVGPPLDPATRMGAIVSREQLDKDMHFINLGISQGAKLVFGGKRIDDFPGYFLQPTIFTEVKTNMEIAREEIFGPVLSVMKFGSVEQAIELANDTEYGLAAGVWTNNITTAHTVSRRLKSGTVWINIFGPFDIASPWTGYKQSGLKTTEWGRNMLDFMTQVKSIWVGL